MSSEPPQEQRGLQLEQRTPQQAQLDQHFPAYGKDLEAKLQSAAKMIHELEAKQPGLKQLLRSRGVGDSAPVVALLVQQAERYHMRNRQ